MIVDRFHFMGQNCSNALNGNLHRILDDDRSVAAEVNNAIIDKCSRHISYLEGRNAVPFMKVLFAHLNAMAHIREHVRRDDLEDDEVGQLLREMFSCSCNNFQYGSDEPFGTPGDGVSVFTVHNHIVGIGQPDSNEVQPENVLVLADEDNNHGANSNSDRESEDG